jgi:hypothetical protein
MRKFKIYFLTFLVTFFICSIALVAVWLIDEFFL